MKKLDVVLIVVFLVISIVLPAYFIAGSHDEIVGNYLEITVDREVVKSIDLPAEDQTFLIETPWGENAVHIEGDSVWIEDADCFDEICVKDGRISKVGDILVCLPHRVILEIKGEEVTGIDAISE